MINAAFGVKAAINTTTAGWLTMLCARLFGRKVEVRDEGELITTTLKVSYWRGRVYMLDYRHISND